MKKSKNISKKRGFTLTEIIVVIALSTLVLAMIGGVLYFVSTYSGVLITKSEQLTRAQTIEKSMRGYAETDISQLAYVRLDSEGNLLFKDNTILKNTGLENFSIYSVGNYEDNPTRYFVKCKFNFPNDEPFDFIVGIAGYIVQDNNDDGYAHHFDNHYNVPCGQEPQYEQLKQYSSVIIPDSVTSIPANAFAGGDFTVNIPSTVTEIGANAFSGCNKLVYLTIPNSVESIGEGAFSNCESLISITFVGTVEQWNAIEKGWDWNSRVPATEVVCSNGKVSLE